MKKYQAKALIKEIIKEIYHGRRNMPSSGEYEDYEIELDGITIPGIIQPTDSVVVNVTIEYSASPGHEATGMFGPPENSEPGESASIDELDYWVVGMTVNGETEINPDSLQPQYQEIIKKAVSAHMSQNQRKIDDMILGGIDFSPPERDYDPDDR
jgi:hypothetical protein